MPEACCTGTCQPPSVQLAGPGESCIDYPCAPTAYCGSNLTCRPLEVRGTSCYWDGMCDFGLVCLGTCEPPLAAGDDCADTGSGQTCGGAVPCDRTTGTCTAWRTEGAACDPSADLCAPAYLHCDATSHRCAPLPGVGESCYETGRCGFGAWCAYLPPDGAVCAALAPDDSQCFSGDRCASGVCASTGVCVEGPVCF